MTRALLIAILISFVGQAAVALEKMNVELLCEGEWRVELRKSQLDDDLGRLMQSLLLAQMEKEQQTFSEQISIKDNKLNDKVPVTVTDTLIITDESHIPESKLKDVPFEISSAKLEIDRLTGKLSGSIKFEKTDITNIPLPNNSKNTQIGEILDQIPQLIAGFSLDGYCSKLDPAKKLF